MASYNYPYHIVKDTPAIAVEVQSNFDGILAWIMSNVIQKDGSVSMTGPLTLAPGDPASGEHAANKAYVDSILPVGIVMEYTGTTLPGDWLWCNGNTYTDASKPLLAAVIGRSFTDAATPAGSFQVPDKRGRVGVGYDATVATEPLGKKGGQRDSELFKHRHTQVPHKHTVPAWTPAATLAPDGAHSHDMYPGSMHVHYQGGTGAAALGSGGPWASSSPWVNAVAHTHVITFTPVPAVPLDEQTPVINEEGTGTVTLDKNMPPYLVCNYIIYAGA